MTEVYLESLLSNPAFIASFWARIDKNGPIPAHCPELGPCWVWTKYRDKNGYGLIAVKRPDRQGTTQLIHRIAYLLTHHDLPSKRFVCHRCDNPSCGNPLHLFLGTNVDNIQDMWDKGRGRTYSARGEKHGLTLITDDQAAEIRARYGQGERQDALAVAYGVGISTIQRLVQLRSWTHVPGQKLTVKETRKGTRNGRALLTPEDVRTIRQRRTLGDNYPTLSKSFGVSESAIGHIISGKNWGHVT